MTIFQLKQWWAHRRRAKNRHGVHSPFVYTFNEDVLNRSANMAQLVQHIATYYEVPGHAPAAAITARSAMHFARIIVLPLTPGATLPPGLTSTDLVLVHPLYTTPAHRQQWQALCADARVTMSIDLFKAGILLFRPEFQVKQHFLLRW